MERVYDRLVASGIDFSRCRSFNLDEYVSLAAADPRSYRTYMNERFFARTAIDLANTHVPDGLAADLHAEAARYERLISEAGGIGQPGIGGDNKFKVLAQSVRTHCPFDIFGGIH